MGNTLSQLESAAYFGGFVLAHAALIASELSGDELICPFAVVTKDDQREVINFEAETQVEAVERGKASLIELKDKIDSWAFAREGLQSLPDRSGKVDVLLVSCWVSGMDEPLVLIQAFTPAQTGNFRLFGPTEIIQDGQTVHSGLVSQLSSAVQQGIGSRHVPWTRWLAHDA
jgi:hypothetical protein